jgi:hypothetical protein
MRSPSQPARPSFCLVADRRGISEQRRAGVREARAQLTLDPDVELPFSRPAYNGLDAP